jgi:ankyrin repeat protein
MKILFGLALFSVAALAVEIDTPLQWAARNDDLASADKLIKAGADVRTADRYGVTPLYLACTNASATMIRQLLDAGADPNGTYASNGETPLMTVIHSEDNIEALQALLDRGADVNIKDTVAGETALMWAVRENRVQSVKLLLAHGAKIDIRTRIGKKPAARPPNAGGGSHGAGIVRSGWPERGFQDATPGGMTALLYASRDGRLDIVRLLLDSKANVNLSEANGITPFLLAILNNHIDVASPLLERGAEVNARDFWGRTPLWAAVDLRNLDVNKTDDNGVDRPAALKLIRMLLDRGADVNVRTQEVPPIRRWIMPIGDLSWADFTGQTPFLRAALSGDVTVMRLLLERGADPNVPTLSGTTGLMAAAGVNWMGGQTYTESKQSLLEAVKLCVEKGADVNAVNSMGIGAVIGAVNRGSDDILQYLVDHGARLDIKDNEGRTPIVWAQGVFLATNPPEAKPSTIALLEKLGVKK